MLYVGTEKRSNRLPAEKINSTLENKAVHQKIYCSSTHLNPAPRRVAERLPLRRYYDFGNWAVVWWNSVWNRNRRRHSLICQRRRLSDRSVCEHSNRFHCTMCLPNCRRSTIVRSINCCGCIGSYTINSCFRQLRLRRTLRQYRTVLRAIHKSN